LSKGLWAGCAEGFDRLSPNGFSFSANEDLQSDNKEAPDGLQGGSALYSQPVGCSAGYIRSTVPPG
jgi:hypothetical protein